MSSTMPSTYALGRGKADVHDGSDRLTLLGRLVAGKGWETFVEVVGALVGEGKDPVKQISLAIALIGSGSRHWYANANVTYPAEGGSTDQN